MRWIGSTEAQKRNAWKAHFSKIDFAAAFARIEAEAAELNASNRSEASKEVGLDTLRAEWKSLRDRQRIAEGR